MKFTFAALTLSAVQAAKLAKHGTTEPPLKELTQSLSKKEEEKPMTYTNIMESVKSLEKAYEFHRNEEKLLDEINSELREYWN